jgi:hypothetical protein
MSDQASALDLLLAAGADLDAVAGLMPHVDPAAVKVKVAPGWMRRIWFEGIAAMTLPTAIYVQPSVMDHYRAGSEPDRWGPLIVHEMMHADQWRRLGVVRYGFRYLGDYLRGRARRRGHWDAYREIRLEVEARDAAARVPFGGPV